MGSQSWLSLVFISPNCNMSGFVVHTVWPTNCKNPPEGRQRVGSHLHQATISSQCGRWCYPWVSGLVGVGGGTWRLRLWETKAEAHRLGLHPVSVKRWLGQAFGSDSSRGWAGSWVFSRACLSVTAYAHPLMALPLSFAWCRFYLKWI